MNSRAWLIDTHAHIPPAAALEQLSVSDAERRVAGASHSIADIVAHMSFWQDWFCRRCEGIAEPVPARAELGWPKVDAGSWPELHRHFVAGLETAASFGDRAGQPLTPPIDFPPLAEYTVGDAIIHMAQHNSHHLGQIVLLRQMIGRWSPPSGSFTW